MSLFNATHVAWAHPSCFIRSSHVSSWKCEAKGVSDWGGVLLSQTLSGRVLLPSTWTLTVGVQLSKDRWDRSGKRPFYPRSLKLDEREQKTAVIKKVTLDLAQKGKCLWNSFFVLGISVSFPPSREKKPLYLKAFPSAGR